MPTSGAIIENENGWVHNNLYVVGWAKRGSSGTIPTNGPDSRNVVELVAENLKKHPSADEKAGSKAIKKLLSDRNIRFVSVSDVEKIAEAEINNASQGHPWEKFPSIEGMLQALET